MRHLLIEDAHPLVTDFLADFCAFACGKLGIPTCPPITFVEHTGNASFGSYSPSEGTIVVATSGRHAADILRTLAHELVHDQQITMGFDGTLEDFEYEANAVAGMLMREYNKLHPSLYTLLDAVHDQQSEHDDEHGESMGATFADPTRPTGPVGLAELTNKTMASYKRDAKAEVKHVRRVGDDGTEFGYRIDFLHNLNKFTNRKKGIKTAENKLRKRYAVQEDAPVNAAGSGQIAGIGIGPQGEPGIKKSKMIRRKPKSGLATIFAGFPKPKKLFKEYSAKVIKKIDWDDVERDTIKVKKAPTPIKGHKTLTQFLKGR